MAYRDSTHAAQVQHRDETAGTERRTDGSVVTCQHCLPGLVCSTHAWWDEGRERA
jgi:hypothetical protein